MLLNSLAQEFFPFESHVSGWVMACAWFWPAVQRPERFVSSAAAERGALVGPVLCWLLALAVPEHNMSSVQHCRDSQESFPVTSVSKDDWNL